MVRLINLQRPGAPCQGLTCALDVASNPFQPWGSFFSLSWSGVWCFGQGRVSHQWTPSTAAEVPNSSSGLTTWENENGQFRVWLNDTASMKRGLGALLLSHILSDF